MVDDVSNIQILFSRASSLQKDPRPPPFFWLTRPPSPSDPIFSFLFLSRLSALGSFVYYCYTGTTFLTTLTLHPAAAAAAAVSYIAYVRTDRQTDRQQLK